MQKMTSFWLRSLVPCISRAITQEFSKRAVHSLSIVTSNYASKLLNTNFKYPSYDLLRHKSKNKADNDSDDEEDYLEGDISLSKDSKVVKFTTTSLRTDTVLKSALGIARNKIEQIFYESKIRVNGRKILKKSAPVRADYEIDVIKHVSPKNPDHLYVARIVVLNVTASEDKIYFTIRRFRNLLIENYEQDPYKSGDTENQE